MGAQRNRADCGHRAVRLGMGLVVAMGLVAGCPRAALAEEDATAEQVLATPGVGAVLEEPSAAAEMAQGEDGVASEPAGATELDDEQASGESETQDAPESPALPEVGDPEQAGSPCADPLPAEDVEPVAESVAEPDVEALPDRQDAPDLAPTPTVEEPADLAPEPAEPAATPEQLAAPEEEATAVPEPTSDPTTATRSQRAACATSADELAGTAAASAAHARTKALSAQATKTTAKSDPLANWKAGHWETKTYKGHAQRFWVGANGKYYKNGLVRPTWGLAGAKAGFWAYARPEGYVVRGTYWSAKTKVTYLANGKGRLLSPGWHTTRAFDGGTKRTYWIDRALRGAKAGIASVGTNDYYVLPEKGYILKGATTVAGKRIWADNKGVLATRVCATIPTADGTKARSTSTTIGTANWLFLPSNAKLSSVRLSSLRQDGAADLWVAAVGTRKYVRVGAGEVVDLTQLHAKKDKNGGLRLKYVLGKGGRGHRLTVMKSRGITSVYVVSASARKGMSYVHASPDHSREADCTVLVVDSKGKVLYNEDSKKSGDLSEIKGRGNATWNGGKSKRPYQVKLSSKADLLDTGDKDNESKKWILLANAYDPTLLRNNIALDLARELGVSSALECAPVDLYYDGQYRGSYLLTEKVEVKGGRVDIADLEEAVEEANEGVDLEKLPTAQGRNKYGYTYQYVKGAKTPKSYTGGYLLERDFYYGTEACWFNTSAGYFVLKSPELTSEKSVRYISEKVQSALKRLAAGKKVSKKAMDLDVDGLAKVYLMHEVLKNVDGFGSSTYFYKDKGGNTLYAGPAWDFDGAFGTRADHMGNATSGFDNPSAGWVRRAPRAKAAAKKLYRRTFSPLVRKVLLGGRKAVGANGRLHSVSYYASRIRASARMDAALYGPEVYEHANHYIAFRKSHGGNVTYLLRWLKSRVAWADANIGAL